MQRIVTPAARRLKCDDPRVKKKWIETMNEFVRENKLIERITEIEQEMTIPLTEKLQKEYNDILLNKLDIILEP